MATVAQPPDPPGTPARRAAMRLLDAVLRRGQPLESALLSATRELERPDDRALAHALAAKVLRHLPDLDALIDSATRQTLPPDAKARTALRIALAGTLALRTPPHAAIATVLPLVDGGPRKLVHGVFGTLTRAGATLPSLPTLPTPVSTRWAAAWGEPVAAAAAANIAAPPPLDLTLKDPAETTHWAKQLGAAILSPGQLRLAEHGPVSGLSGFAEGAWWVQDVAAAIPASLLGNRRGTVLDICAAPGGKTLQLAAAGWEVTALDISESRLARLRANLTRTRLHADVISSDALRWAPPGPFDAILLDAPCSATGIFRRHPDVLHRVRPALIEEMAALQAQLLDRAARWLRPGGVLVYATCSLEPDEGEAVIGRFLASRSDYAMAPIAADEPPAGISPSPHGWLRTLPGTLGNVGGCDGFFIARLVHKG